METARTELTRGPTPVPSGNLGQETEPKEDPCGQRVAGDTCMSKGGLGSKGGPLRGTRQAGA